MSTPQKTALTVVVSRRVIKGKESEFEKLSTEMTQRAATFPGYLGATGLSRRPGVPNCLQVP